MFDIIIRKIYEKIITYASHIIDSERVVIKFEPQLHFLREHKRERKKRRKHEKKVEEMQGT